MSEKISVMIPEADIRRRIEELGEEISRDYEGKELRLICILKGGVYFMTALSQKISEKIPVSTDYMSVSSYGDDVKSSGIVKIIKDLDEYIVGKHVLLVEDIIDSGITLSYLLELLGDRKPADIKLCTLLDKPSGRVKDVKVDYVGFEIEDNFVVGWGMDYQQKYRNLPYVGFVELEEDS